MITYESALKKAKRLKPNVDNCTEHEDAFVFGSHADDMSFGGDGPVVILKKSGEAINMTAYLTECEASEIIQEHSI